MWYNPSVLVNPEFLTDTQILWSIYQLLLAAITLSVGAVIFYLGFKLIVWLVPNFWYRSKK